MKVVVKVKVSQSLVSYESVLFTVFISNTTNIQYYYIYLHFHQNKYPWIVAVLDAVYNDRICGGTLVGSKYVITAAQCLYDRVSDDRPILEKYVKVRIGDHNLDVNGDINERTISVSKIRNHPKYKYNRKHHSRKNDISILELAEEVDLSIYTPACLAPRIDMMERYDGKTAQVFGWGEVKENKPNDERVLRKINVTVETDCERKRSQICARAVMGQDWCNGDEGGPLTYKSSGQNTLIGVVSYGYGDCADAEVGVCMDQYCQARLLLFSAQIFNINSQSVNLEIKEAVQ